MRATSRPMSASSMRAGRRLCPAWSMPTATSPSLAARTGSSVVPILRKNCSRSRSTTETSWVARACAGPATSGPRSPWIPGMDGGGPSPSACGNGGSRTRTGRGSGSREPGSATAASSQGASRSRRTTAPPSSRRRRPSSTTGRTSSSSTSMDRRRKRRPGRRTTCGPSSNSRTVAARRSPRIPVSSSAPGSGSTPASIPSNTDSSSTRTRSRRWPARGRSS